MFFLSLILTRLSSKDMYCRLIFYVLMCKVCNYGWRHWTYLSQSNLTLLQSKSSMGTWYAVLHWCKLFHCRVKLSLRKWGVTVTGARWHLCIGRMSPSLGNFILKKTFAQCNQLPLHLVTTYCNDVYWRQLAGERTECVSLLCHKRSME